MTLGMDPVDPPCRRRAPRARLAVRAPRRSRPSGSRAAGMGGAFVAVADDASAVYWNPAGFAAGSFFSLVARPLHRRGRPGRRRRGRQPIVVARRAGRPSGRPVLLPPAQHASCGPALSYSRRRRRPERSRGGGSATRHARHPSRRGDARAVHRAGDRRRRDAEAGARHGGVAACGRTAIATISSTTPAIWAGGQHAVRRRPRA